MTKRGIVLAGIVVLDIVHIIDHWPAEETLAFIDRTEMAAGGPPHNAAAGLLQLGADFPVTLLASSGSDAYGEIMLASARGYGLDTSRVAMIPGAVTSHTHVMSCKDTGRRTFFAQLGCNNLMTVEHLMPPEDSNARIYYLGSPGTARALDRSDGWRTLLSAARARGMKTCLELCPVPADDLRQLVPPCLPLCDVFVVNDYEAASITAVDVAPRVRLDWHGARRPVGNRRRHRGGRCLLCRGSFRSARELVAGALPRPRQRRRRHVAPFAHHQCWHPSVGGMPGLCQGQGPALDLGPSLHFHLGPA